MKYTASLVLGGAASTSAFVGLPFPTSLTMNPSRVNVKASRPMERISRSELSKASTTSAISVGALFSGEFPPTDDVPYTLPDLPYPYEALEPHIDTATMKFHHDKHHAAYVANSNKAYAAKSALPIVEIQKQAIKDGTNNAVGGHYNHCLFWNTLCAAEHSGSPSAELAKAIDSSFGSMENMKKEFKAAAASVFGSGWAWLGCSPDGKLAITSTPNQDNPLMEGATCRPMIPIVGLDVWEHAYYLKYQNRRPDYIGAFWNIVNWAVVSENFEMFASKNHPVPVQG